MMKLVMGLGNPGSEYQNHRHNVGYMILDKVAKKLNVELDIKKKKTERIVILPLIFLIPYLYSW